MAINTHERDSKNNKLIKKNYFNLQPKGERWGLETC